MSIVGPGGPTYFNTNGGEPKLVEQFMRDRLTACYEDAEFASERIKGLDAVVLYVFRPEWKSPTW